MIVVKWLGSKRRLHLSGGSGVEGAGGGHDCWRRLGAGLAGWRRRQAEGMAEQSRRQERGERRRESAPPGIGATEAEVGACCNRCSSLFPSVLCACVCSAAEDLFPIAQLIPPFTAT